METSTRILIDKILFVLGMTMFVVGLVGEIRGWWDAVGVIVSLGGLLVGLFSAMDRSGLALLEGQSTTHTVQMRMASRQATMLATQEEMVTNQEEMLANQEKMVGNQEKMIGNQEAMVAKQQATIELLDRIAETLDNRLPES